MKKLLILSLLFTSCAKEHSEYRYTPKYHVNQLVQYRKDIEHDFGAPGKRLWDVPQPFTITGYYYFPLWRDNWYYITDANGVSAGSVDELSLQEWRGSLEK